MCKFTEKAAPYELKRLLKELFLKDKFYLFICKLNP